ncbi:hypothetical protein V6N13_067248 [Hibiscus sabdariffa]|uniref:Uncharacterized protein n=1 Tax=Hibiscus sabdariffa TaxID=183260 RepID=A0ABR2DSV8_9ROSI
MKPRLPNYAIGNLHGIAVSTYNSAERDIELHELSYLAREALDVFNDQLGQQLQTTGGWDDRQQQTPTIKTQQQFMTMAEAADERKGE